MKNYLLKTKENYPHNSKYKYEKKYLVWILVAFLVLYGGRDIVGGMSSFFTTPIYVIRHYIETSSATIPVFIRSRIELVHQIQTLQDQIASQKGSDVARVYLEEENKELRNLLHASSSEKILAGVIARPPFTPYDSIVIDKGDRDGIIENAPVYYGTGMALGYVRKVFAHSALVTLLSSPNVESTVYVFGPNIFTSAYGEGGGVVRLSIPQGLVVEKGNLVILPSLDAGVLGTVALIESIPTEPEQRAYVTLDIGMQSIRLVTVGTTPMDIRTYEEALQIVEKETQARFRFTLPEDFKVGSSSAPSVVKNASSSTSTR